MNLIHGFAQDAQSKRWFSLSEEAYSSGAVLYPTAEAAAAVDAVHHAFMAKHHPQAKARAPYIPRSAA